MGYLANFMVYTFAMVGIIFVALLIFKNSTGFGAKNSASKILKIHDTLSLGPRKTLYIVSAGKEKFLIAGDVDKTCLISKLEVKENNIEFPQNSSFKEIIEDVPLKTSYMDKSSIGIYSTKDKPYDSVMKNLAERIRQ